MKIAVLNFSGKVGKSSLCNTLLYSNMPQAKIFRLETVNESGFSGADEEKKMKGRDLEKLQIDLAKTNDAIVDVGASNVESFILALNQQFDSHMDFDLFLVPIKAQSAAQIELQEAIKTLQSLSSLGIEPERIKVVFNMLPVDSSVEEEVKALFNFHKKNQIFTLIKDAAITDSPAFKSLAIVGKSYIEAINDETNYREKLKDIPLENEKERVEMTKLMRAQGTAKALKREIDNAFSALFEA